MLYVVRPHYNKTLAGPFFFRSDPYLSIRPHLHSRYRYFNLETKRKNGALGHESVVSGYTRLGITLGNEMNFGMNHAPDAGLIT